jgi:hypothetical protein
MKIALSQRGMALLMILLIVILIASTVFLRKLDANGINNERAKTTQKALAEAKIALLSFASNRPELAGCGNNCPRPGDLPCPDINNNGFADAPCGNAAGTTGQANRLGRLPWRDLGITDLRDGYGERLWYAVSSRYKNNSRFRPLNSDTTATITLRNSAGNIINNGSATTGLAAVVISPGPAFARADAITQVRNGANQNLAVNYLDIAFGEDNQNFVDSGINGFISGPVRNALGNLVVNDRILAISSADMAEVMEKRVLAEVRNALRFYFNNEGAQSYPAPANFNDVACLGFAAIPLNCSENAAITRGRIPANPITDWNATSILRGEDSNNWFQLNGWREHIYYGVAPACITGTANCSGAGFLTLNNALTLPAAGKQLVIIASGSGLPGQVRAIAADRTQVINYLEDENLMPLDDVYVRTSPLTPLINDRAISFP